MVDYFLGGSDAFLLGMGVDVDKLPTREAWLGSVWEDHLRPDTDKSRLYVAWLHAGDIVGHSSVSHIQWGRSAHCHLHLWRRDLRGSGLGPACLKLSIDLYFERLALRTMICEPFAENPGPNRVLPGLGFQFVKRYRTTPTSGSTEQEVARFEVTREEWFAGRSDPGCASRG